MKAEYVIQFFFLLIVVSKFDFVSMDVHLCMYAASVPDSVKAELLNRIQNFIVSAAL